MYSVAVFIPLTAKPRQNYKNTLKYSNFFRTFDVCYIYLIHFLFYYVSADKHTKRF